MFTGEYLHSLDNKGRVTIPVQFRSAFQSGLIVTRGHDPCLVVYTPDGWQALAEKASRLPSTSRAARAYNRWVFGSAFECVPDRAGRILIPGVLRAYAGIEDNVILAGANNHVEIWNPERWNESLAQALNDMETNAEDLAKLGI